MSAAFVTTRLDRSDPRQATRPGVWARLRAAIAAARLDRTEREIANYIEEHGGRLTDDIERRILSRVSGFDKVGFF